MCESELSEPAILIRFVGKRIDRFDYTVPEGARYSYTGPRWHAGVDFGRAFEVVKRIDWPEEGFSRERGWKANR